MQQLEASSVIAEIQESAIRANSDVRFVESHQLGAFGRQGDIYFDGLKAIPEGAVKVDTNQLAAGDTLGSRHVATGDVQLYRPLDYGQVITTGEGKFVRGFVMEVGRERCRVEHPEHATFDLPEGAYSCDHQYDPVMDRRVAD